MKKQRKHHTSEQFQNPVGNSQKQTNAKKKQQTNKQNTHIEDHLLF